MSIESLFHDLLGLGTDWRVKELAHLPGAHSEVHIVIEATAGLCERYKCPDDGGSVLEVYIEVDTPSLSLIEQIPDFPLFEIVPKWGGWRCQILKVPPGYIDAILLSTDKNDY